MSKILDEFRQSYVAQTTELQRKNFSREFAANIENTPAHEALWRRLLDRHNPHAIIKYAAAIVAILDRTRTAVIDDVYGKPRIGAIWET